MLEAVFGIVGIVLVILGLVEVVRLITLMIFRTKKDRNVMMVVPICGHSDEVEFLIRSAAARIQWMGAGYQRILCVDCGMDEETRKICRMIQKDYPFIEFCSMSEFEAIVEGKT